MSEERNNPDREVSGDSRVQESNSWVGLILRVVLSAIVISIAAFLSPGFSINGMWPVLLAAVVISVVNFLLQKVSGLSASPFGRGFSGFIVSVIVLYAAQFLIPTMNVTLIGAMIGALVIGIIDMVIPGQTF